MEAGTVQSATTKAIHYFRPLCLEHSLELLAQKQLTIVAGATDLYPAKVAHNGWGDWRQQALLDISGLSELQGISDRNSHFRIGALTTWSHIAQAALPAYFTPLQQAAQCIGALQIQNRGTIGGNICNASPAADGVPVLLCLDAQVELSSQSGVRILRLDEFVLGYRKTARQENELVTAILIPKLAGRALGGFEKLGSRSSLVISIVMVAMVLVINKQQQIEDVRIAIGACSEVAQRMSALEAVLKGHTCGAELAKLITPGHFSGLTPIDDMRASADYRRHCAEEISRRLLLSLCQQQECHHA
jgi:CO/xanthine dehydrogenase FAD-binding subunit